MSPDLMKGSFIPRLAAADGNKLSREKMLQGFANRYWELLSAYQKTEDEALLRTAFALGKEMVREDIFPDEVADIHFGGISRFSSQHEISSKPYMELMVAFGCAHRAMAERIHADGAMRSEYERLKHALGDTIQAINTVREMKDVDTASHQKRVALLACEIAKELGLDDNRVEGLKLAASLHDVGMVQVPKEILAQAGGLDTSEMDMVKSHPLLGYDMLKDIDMPWPVADITCQHHERIDGTGYPYGLVGDQILIEAKIISVADTVEAMVSRRPYRAALDISQALEEIQKGRGTCFDAEIVDICCRLFTKNAFTFH